ncbi:hypothetical protein SELMODRAFT_421796 [Selaginella moellendorffii]|uniref:Translocation and assembly module TamB C-terminal domain-containing protein n=1 Tax=Selaginella moellendorffii TaxID=88036 RepID=D8SGD9_SELML|nr:uncharacterized protein LOC9660996 [Selaginella moellendorffii]EFJ16558.1 hypothetical protein SELMODRAFT_421796 [Selaginella moellendorffii]|eukprot:XP_002982313.1 uncharacterized protein LOC9660996 [Selaginella moellendorffii]
MVLHGWASATAALSPPITPPRRRIDRPPHCLLPKSKLRSWLWPHRRRKWSILAGNSSGSEFWQWRPGSSQAAGSSSARLLRLIARSVAVVIVTILSGVVALRIRGLAQDYIETKLLPPIAMLLGERLSRQVELGKVAGLSPLGISLRDCSIGPHDQDFSCAQLPVLTIRINPVRSFQRRQLAADLILSHPHLLVAQRQDWTWLGLPAVPPEKIKRLLHDGGNDETVDSRTRIRRLARESSALKQADERIKAARRSANLGYRPAAFGNDNLEAGNIAVGEDGTAAMRGPLHGAKSWVKEHLPRQTSSASDKAYFQKKNLRASAAKARTFFQKTGGAPVGSHRIPPSMSQSYKTTEFERARNSNAVDLTRQSSTAAAVDDLQQDGKSSTSPVTIESVYIRDGTFLLLAFGDNEPRVLDQFNGRVDFASDYQVIDAQVSGVPKVWRRPASEHDAGLLNVVVHSDIKQQQWDVKIKARNLFVPLVERLLELPIDFYSGTAHGEVHVRMNNEDNFPQLGGKVDIKNVSFKIVEAPAAFKEVNGTIFLQGQRAFLHNTSGLYGKIPVNVSGDMDVNPENGEFRLSCQVPGVEVNSLMTTLKVRPPPFPVAGAVKAVVYCRGPLDAPIFEGSAETLKNRTDLTFNASPSKAIDSIRNNLHKGAAAAYDNVAFTMASGSFTFDTDGATANIYGIRATPVGGGEIRGAGDMWICPEGEIDPTAIRIDCSGYVMINDIIGSYTTNEMKLPLFGAMHGEAKVRGSLQMPVFDIKWVMPDAKGSFTGSRGDISISDEAIVLNSSSFTFDVNSKMSTVPVAVRKNKSIPTLEGLELDARFRGFDILDFLPSAPSISPDSTQMKATCKLKFQGRFVSDKDTKMSGLVGDVSLSGLKLNQLLVASHSSGLLDVSGSGFKLITSGRGKEHLTVQLSKNGHEPSSFSLQRGKLQVDASHSPHSLAKLEIRNLPLDELELSSLRGMMHKVDIQLNLDKRRGHGCLSVGRPRFSGMQGELLDVSARWSGDVVTLEKSLLEQADSTYELRGEYVLPGPREKAVASGNKRHLSDGMWQKLMAGHLENAISSLGRWRLRLEVPRAELSDMLPVARLLSRSSDPAIVTRSKELFLQEVEKAAFLAHSLKQQMEFLKKESATSPQDRSSADSLPLPGLAELNGRWHGTFEASGGGNSDMTASLDLHGENWEWGVYNIQSAVATGSYCYTDGLRLEKVFLQKDTATLHADGMLGPNSNLHFALLNFPVELVPPLMQAIQSSSVEPLQSSAPHAPLNGVLHMEGDLRGDCNKPECDVHVRLLDGAIGGINLSKADLAASVTSGNQFVFNARLEPVVHAGHVYVRGSIPLGSKALDPQSKSRNAAVKRWMGASINNRGHGNSEGQTDYSTSSEWDFIDAGALYVDVVVKDSGMMLLTTITPNMKWLQGNADVRLQVRGASEQPKFDGMAVFHKATVSSPILPKPAHNIGGTVTVKNNELIVDAIEGKVGKRGRLLIKGKLPLKAAVDSSDCSLEVKADSLEVRAKNMLSGQVDGQLSVMGSLSDPELTGVVKLSRGELYLSQEKNSKAATSTIPRALSDLELVKEESHERKLPVAVRLKGLKLQFGPELRMVYPLILNFAVNGELEFHGFADSERVKPKGVLTFENGDVNLVATQVRLNKDYPNRAKFEPEQGLDPNLDLALVGLHFQLKVQGRAQNWQDSIVLTYARSGEQDTLTRIEAAKLFENQLVDSLLEGNGQFAFKKLAAATVETLMPKIETKGEFGQARWRLVYAPQIPNLLSLDPTTDPFKSLANLSFGTEVEVRLGKHLQASVVRQLKESEMATQWTLIYHLNNKLRLVFSSIPSVDNRLLLEYSAS